MPLQSSSCLYPASQSQPRRDDDQRVCTRAARRSRLVFSSTVVFTRASLRYGGTVGSFALLYGLLRWRRLPQQLLVFSRGFHRDFSTLFRYGRNVSELGKTYPHLYPSSAVSMLRRKLARCLFPRTSLPKRRSWTCSSSFILRLLGRTLKLINFKPSEACRGSMLGQISHLMYSDLNNQKSNTYNTFMVLLRSHAFEKQKNGELCSCEKK